MKLSKVIEAMRYDTKGTAYRNLYVIVKPLYGLTPVFQGTVQELIDAYHNKEEFGSAGAKSWMVSKFCHTNIVTRDIDLPEYNKSILIEVF